MTVIAIVAVCVLLLFLGFVAPRLSRYPQSGAAKSLGAGRRTAAKAPGRLGGWLQKPFTKSMKATDKSAATGREARSKLPI